MAIPFVNVRSGPEVQQRAPADKGVFVTSSYIGTAHAVRRDGFRDVGAYRTSLIRQVEEPDFCLRMLDAGFVTRLGRSDPLIHDESPRRDLGQTYYYAFRNEVLHGWNNVPLPYLAVRLGKPLDYDAEKMQVTNSSEAAALINPPYRRGWEI